MRSVAEKMGLKKGMKFYLLNPPDNFLHEIAAPQMEPSSRLTGAHDYLHFFAKNEADLSKNFARLKEHLKPTGTLWISWKKAKAEGSDLTIKDVIRIGYDHGLVESKTISINERWSAIKFTFPKAGKVYQNSYGKLP